MKYYRTDVLTAAKKHFGRKQLALEEVDGVFRIRTVRDSFKKEVVIDGIRHLYEDSKTLAGPWKTLADAAKFFGVKQRL